MNEQVAAVAGPCNNYESLYTLEQFAKLSFDDVKSSEELTQKWKAFKDLTSHWEELLSSCKTAVVELKKASKTSKPAPKKKGNGKAKAKSKASKDTCEGAFQIFDFDFVSSLSEQIHHIPKHQKMSEEVDFSKPFILTPISALCHLLKDRQELQDEANKDMLALKDELEKFEKTFAQSDLRFVAGKAQQPVQEVAEGIIRSGASNIQV